MMARTTLRREVVRADPDWNKQKRNEVEYEFSNGRKFYRNPEKSEIYTGDEEEE